MPRIIHPLAGLIAILTIATFWLSTALSELFASEATKVAVKTAIPWGFILLVPALAAAGGSGLFLSNGRRDGLVGVKLKRMPLIAANGLLILVPSALFLAFKAGKGQFDSAFYLVQVIELVAGAVNITLLGKSMRDGLAITQWKRSSFLKPAATLPARLTFKGEAAKGTPAFSITKPEGFEFIAGQALYMTLPDLKNMDARGCARVFSIASAPQDVDLEVVTRNTGTRYKKYMEAAHAGVTVNIEGPYGDLVLHDDATRPAVFLAGGIGVTPFRSIVLDATHRGLKHRIFLFYCNRTPEDAAFLEELCQLELRNPRFRLIETFTEAWDSSHQVKTETGRISADMLSRHIGELSSPVFYVAGPPAMVADMEEILEASGVAAADIRKEAFSGY